MIKTCENKCQHDFQDRVYGKDKRVMNEMAGTGTGKNRCTVCGKVTTLSMGKGKGKP